MKWINIHITLLISLFFSNCLNAQGNYALSFIENKGQWQGDFLFKTSLRNGSLFLQKQGYSVALYNPNEIATVFGHELTGEDSDERKRIYYNTGKNLGSSEKQLKNDVVFHMHAYSMKFAGSNPNPSVSVSKPTGDVSNYLLGNDPSKWQTDVKSYYNVLKENVYPGIDVKYYTYADKLKYDVILHPGADLSRVAMQYEGLDKISLSKGKLKLETSLGEIAEYIPYAYQIIDGMKKEVSCQYRLVGKTVSYDVQNYDKKNLLVIDPVIILATFTGSKSDNWGFTAAPGPDGSTFAGGIAFGQNFPTTLGAFQRTWNSGSPYEKGMKSGVDMTITKYNPDSKKSYSTFIGGTDNETPHSIYVNNNGEAFILGHTNSTDFPNPQKTKFGSLGQYDIVICKLSADGKSITTAIVGGTEDDGLNINDNLNPEKNSLKQFYGDNSRSELVLDENDNVYVAASTFSNSSFPIKNASQTTNRGGQDGVLLKLNSSLSTLLFSTFIGGSDDDAAFSLAISPTTKKIYVSGVTKSYNLKVTTSGQFGNKSSGGIDGFITSFNPTGTWDNAIYLGTNATDFIYGIQFDLNGFPYVTGVTSGNWPVTPAGIYSNNNAKQFIAKLKADLTGFVYSTVYGSQNNTNPSFSPTAFLVDRCENVYVSGWGVTSSLCASPSQLGGTWGMSITNDAIKKKTDGADFYFFVLAKDGARQLYGSFFGQEGGLADHVDGGTSRFDKNGVIYQAICANCYQSNTACPSPIVKVNLPIYSSEGIVTSTNKSSACNIYVLKMDFELSGVKAGIKTNINGIDNKYFGCTPLKVDFSDSIAQGVTYTWDFGDGKTASGSEAASHIYTTTGTYTVTLTASDPLRTCNPVDVNTVKIVVASDKVNLVAKANRPSCLNRDFVFTNTSTTVAGASFGSTSFVWDFGDNSASGPLTTGLNTVTHTFPADGTYIVKLKLNDNRYCNDQEVLEIKIQVTSKVVASIKGPSLGCITSKGKPFLAEFASVGLGGQTFEWDFNDGSPISTSSNPSHLFKTPGDYLVKLTVTDPFACPDFRVDKTTFPISIKPSPIAGFSYSPNPPDVNTPVQFTNLSTGNKLVYEWDFGDGVTSTAKDTLHLYQKTDKFIVKLIVIDQFACEDTAYTQLNAKVVPLVDVSSAFTPNGDGTNDKVYVRGFGITQMNFRIYNRWGQVVFESASPYFGWDGKYKGELQPMDVYSYTLIVAYSDGTTATKKGDITLIR